MSLLELIPTTGQPTHTKADFDSYQAAPLLLFGSGARRDVVKRQDALAENFQHAIREELSPLVKDRVVNFVIHSVISRMHQREGLNGVSYMRRLYENPQYGEVPLESPAFIDNAIQQALDGGSTVYQNRIARQALGMATIELANHTVFGEFRKDEEVPMIEDISALVSRDATPKFGDMYRLRILGFDRDLHSNQHIGAMRIGMKRFVGESEDGTIVKARTTAIINTSPSSGFNQELLEEFRDSKLSLDELPQLFSFRKAVKWLVESEVPAGFVLAKNETFYEEHIPTQEVVTERHGFGLFEQFRETGHLEIPFKA